MSETNTTTPVTQPSADVSTALKGAARGSARKPILEAPMPPSTEMGIPSAEAEAYADALRQRPGPDRWEPSRLIVCNWWMFTYQEFLVIDGHLVLNGLNGSGKSSVAATAVPVALDMLKHKRRFDPFGADERDPKEYLIGKWEASPNSDEFHEDRTGYVIWEFRHRRTGGRVTCGVGFRARRVNGKDGEVDHWGFVVSGLAYRKDFSIFTAGGEPLTRTELTKRLGASCVFQSPKDYQRAVNAALYGFERPERLKELMDVLVELRKPKLQKGVTPEHLSDSLSAALPPLANAVTEQLSALVASINAALEAVQRTREHVGRIEALDKAQGEYEFLNAQVHAVDVIDASDAYERAQKKLTEAEHHRFAVTEECDRVDASVRTREIEIAEAKAAIIVIQGRDEFQHVGAFERAEQDVALSERELTRARSVTEKVQEQINREEGARERLAHALRGAIGEIEVTLDELDEAAGPTRWSEVQPRLTAARGALAGVTLRTDDGGPAAVIDALGLSDLRAMWISRESALTRLVKVHEELAKAMTEFQKAEAKLAAVKASADSAGAIAREARNENDDALDALPDALRSWANTVPTVQAVEGVQAAIDDLGTMIETTATLDADGAPRPGIELVQPIGRLVEDAAEAVQEDMRAVIESRVDLVNEQKQLQAERDDLLAMPFARPKPRVGQEKLREALETIGAPVVPLYMALDLAPGVEASHGARIERILEEAGVLDALLITVETRTRLERGIQEGMIPDAAADRWLVGDPSSQSRDASRSSLLGAASDQLSPAVLEAVAAHVGALLAAGDGRWKLGALEGWVGPDMAAATPRYLGTENRRRARDARLAELNGMLAALANDITRADETIKLYGATMRALKHAGRDLPALLAVRTYDETRQRRVVSARNASALAEEFSKHDIETQRARASVTEAQTAVERAVAPVRECRDLSGLEVRDLIAATRSMLREVQNCEQDIARLGEYRTKDEEIGERLDERRGELAEASEYEVHASTELAGRRARLEQIRRIVESPDVRRLQEDLAKARAQESESQAELNRLLPEQGRLRDAVTRAATNENECTDKVVERRAALDQQALLFRATLARYPQPDLVQARDLFEEAGQNGGPVGAARDLLRRRRAVADMRRNVTADRDGAFRALSTVFAAQKNPLAVFRPEFSDADVQIRLVEQSESRQVSANELLNTLRQILADQEQVATRQENELYEKYFLGDVSVKVRERIAEAQALVKEIGATLERMTLSNGAHFTLAWQAKSGGNAGPEYSRLVRLVQFDPEAMTATTRKEMIDLFRARVERARAKLLERGTGSLADMLQKELDYRAWFEFKLAFVKVDGTKMSLEKNALSKLSGGERTLAQVLPLLSAVHTYSESGRPDAPKLIYFDEAFAGVDAANTEGTLRILQELDFSWILTSDKFWGTSRHISASATYTLTPVRQAVLSMLHIWDGSQKVTERDLAKHVAKHGHIPGHGRNGDDVGLGAGVRNAPWRRGTTKADDGVVGSIAVGEGAPGTGESS